VPVLVTTMTPFVTVIACMFSVARLQHANEVVPMLFVGRSIQPCAAADVAVWAGLPAAWHGLLAVGGAPHRCIDHGSRERSLVKGLPKQKFLVIESGESPRLSLSVREYDPPAQKMAGVNMLVEGDLKVDNSLLLPQVPPGIGTGKTGDWSRAGSAAVRVGCQRHGLAGQT
jgi:hypothetical protein